MSTPTSLIRRLTGPTRGSGQRRPPPSSYCPPCRRPAAAAERNLGLCRLWLGEQKAGVEALRRWLEHASPTPDAVDLGVLALLLDETPDREPVEHVQLTWPLRDRKALMETLIHLPDVIEGPDRRLDPADKESPEVLQFLSPRSAQDRCQARPDASRNSPDAGRGLDRGRDRGA